MKNIAVFQKDIQSHELVLLNLFEKAAYIGSSQQADIVVSDLRCAGIHAIIKDINEKDGNEKKSVDADFVIIDLGNGSNTFYQDKRQKQFHIKSGECFTIGNTTLTIKRIPQVMLAYQNLLPQTVTEQQISTEKKLAIASDRSLLEVSLFWGQQLLDARTFSGKSTISVGSEAKNTFAITLPDRKEQRIALFKKDSLQLRLPHYAKGIFWEGESTYTIDQLKEKEKDTNKANNESDLIHGIRIGDRADIQLGEMTLSFKFVEPPKKIGYYGLPTIDWKLVRIYLSFLALAALLSGVIHLFEDKSPKVIEVPENIKKVLYEAGIKSAKEKQRSAIGEILAQGGRAKGEEGASKSQKTPTPEQATKIAQKDLKKDTVKTESKSESKQTKQTINRPDLSALMAKSSASEATAIAIEGPASGGNTLSSISQGGFARGSKGLGSGGGGQSVGIGQIQGTSTGGGLGAGDMGLAPSKGISIDSRIEEEVILQDALDPEVINAIIRRYLPQIDHCYQSRLVVKPKLKGKVKVEFTIVADGSVNATRIDETTLNDGPTEKCILEKIRLWKFPTPKGGGKVKVKYPFILMTTSENE